MRGYLLVQESGLPPFIFDYVLMLLHGFPISGDHVAITGSPTHAAFAFACGGVWVTGSPTHAAFAFACVGCGSRCDHARWLASAPALKKLARKTTLNVYLSFNSFHLIRKGSSPGGEGA